MSRREPTDILGPRVQNAAMNYLTTMAFIGIGLWFYTFQMGRFNSFLAINPGPNAIPVYTRDLFNWLAIGYAVVLIPYYILQPNVVSKARIFFSYLFDQIFASRRRDFGQKEKQAALNLLLKLFFVPLMVNWMLGNTGEVMNHWEAFSSRPAEYSFLATFNTQLFWLIFKAELMIDTFLFTLGYMIEVPVLKNEIRSVDPTASGWVVCLLCYPPFNGASSTLFPWQSSDFPHFFTPELHIALNFLILLSMAIYAYASVALFLRASNLTNRGIVAHGPYSVVRHPAYISKNFAWWIGALPILWGAFEQSLNAGLYSLTCLVAWTLIYLARALTEERHLLMIDNGYAAYANRVRYRFLPGVY